VYRRHVVRCSLIQHKRSASYKGGDSELLRSMLCERQIATQLPQYLTHELVPVQLLVYQFLHSAMLLVCCPLTHYTCLATSALLSALLPCQALSHVHLASSGTHTCRG